MSICRKVLPVYCNILPVFVEKEKRFPEAKKTAASLPKDLVAVFCYSCTKEKATNAPLKKYTTEFNFAPFVKEYLKGTKTR